MSETGSKSPRPPNGMVKCLQCDAVLESKHRHDFVSCKCENGTFVDGGNSYLRCGGKDMSKVQVLQPAKFVGAAGTKSNTKAVDEIPRKQ